MNVLQVRAEFEDNGPGSQALTIACQLRKLGINVAFVASGGQMLPLIERSGFQVERVPWLSRNARNPLGVLRASMALSKILRGMEIDIVHTHNAAATYCAFIAKQLSRRPVKLFHSVRGIELRSSHAWRNYVYWNYPATMFAVCEYTRDRLVEIGAPAERIIVTYNGVDLERFDPTKGDREKIRREFSLESSAVVVGHVGSMRQDAKGQSVLLEAISRLLPDFTKLRVVLVGDGEYRCRFEHEASMLGIGHAVRFAGMRFDVPDFQAAFDIFCLPSIRGEMFPNAILEAMAMANPWVGSDISGLGEMSAGGEAGTLVTPSDAADLASKLAPLIRDSHLRRSMGLRGRQEVEKRFSIEKVVERILRAYEQ